MNDIYTTDTATLCSMAEELRADAKAMFPFNKGEAMRLFKLFRRITEELHRREKLSRFMKSQAYKYN